MGDVLLVHDQAGNVTPQANSRHGRTGLAQLDSQFTSLPRLSQSLGLVIGCLCNHRLRHRSLALFDSKSDVSVVQELLRVRLDGGGAHIVRRIG